MSRVLLDTSACSAYFGGDRAVACAMGDADGVLLPIFTLGELYAGFRAGSRLRRNLGVLRRLVSKPSVAVLDATADTADIYGRLVADLRQAGTPLPNILAVYEEALGEKLM